MCDQVLNIGVIQCGDCGRQVEAKKLLRDVLRKRKDLKLILMSATLDAETFENYFKSSCSVGKVAIDGRTHAVQDIYLDAASMADGSIWTFSICVTRLGKR